MLPKFLKAVRASLLTLILANCANNKFVYKGISKKSLEEFYYGKGFSVRALYVKENMADIQLALKNKLALSNSGMIEAEWKRISSLSTNKGLFLLFELYPKTMLPQSFLNFRFFFNEKEVSHVDNYYIYLLEASALTTRPSPFLYGGHMYSPFARSYAIVEYTPSIKISGKHCYKFLLQVKEQKSLQTGDKLRIVTPHGNEILFEYKK